MPSSMPQPAVHLLVAVHMPLHISKAFTPLLQPRVRLGVNILCAGVEVHPIRAGILELVSSHVGPVLSRDLIWQLKELKSQTFPNVPCDVTVHQPSTWVVRLEGNYSPARREQNGNVTTRRIDEVEISQICCWIECACSLPEEREVMPV